MGSFFRQLFRLSFHVAAACSACVLVACLLLWPRSYYYTDSLECYTSSHIFYLQSNTGRVVFHRHENVFSFSPYNISFGGQLRLSLGQVALTTYSSGPTRWSYQFRSFKPHDPHEVGFDYAGVSAVRWYLAGMLLGWYCEIPFSYLTVLSSLLPALWLRRHLRQRKLRNRPGFPVALQTPGGSHA